MLTRFFVDPGRVETLLVGRIKRCAGAGVINDRQLATVLGELARTLATDFPIQGILDELVTRTVAVLPITAAGVVLFSDGPGPHHLAASDDAALAFERLQTTTGQGPCVTAFRTGEAVLVPDVLAGDVRFPEFCAAAADAGLAAVFTFPLHHGATGDRLGALDLYRDVPGPLDPEDLAAAETIADVATAYLLNARTRADLRNAAEGLRESTLHDPLTGLPNRVLLQQRLEHAAAGARRTHARAAVLFVDLDDFKAVNDTHGHQVGDELLVAVAERLGALIRPGDTLARVGGDEFVILCEDLGAGGDAETLAERICGALTLPFRLSGPAPGHGQVVVQVKVSIGIAFSGHADEIDFGLVRDADTAMYQAKRRGGGRHQVLDLREADVRADHAALARDLHRALADGQLELVYQPIVRPADGLVTGAEALLRWTHPTRGPIPAPLTVALAEDTTLIQEIGAWVLRRACAEQAAWSREVPGAQLELAVNVSPRQLMGGGFRDTVADVLASTGADPTRITLEVTEGVFLADGPRAMTLLSDLKDLGPRVALDDFGTGYSSLSYLRQFPVDIVKIDQGFIADVGHNDSSGAIVAAVTGLAHALGMRVTAEGVETPEQRDAIVAVGCEAAQGFYYSRPLSAPAFRGLLVGAGAGAARLP